MGTTGRPALTVVQLLPALEGGGVERGTLEVAAALVQNGHRSLVISAGGAQVARLEAEGSRHIDWPLGRKSPLTLRWAARLRRLLAEERVDILHARSRMPAWVAWRAWRAMPPGRRPRFVTTAHGLYSKRAYSVVMTRGERVIAVSNHVREDLVRRFPALDPQRIALIPRGIDTTAWYPGYRPAAEWLDAWYRRFPATRGRFVVTLPGRLTRRKGVPDFLDIIARLLANGVPVHGLLVGRPPTGRQGRFLRDCQARIAAAGLDRAVTLTGPREDLREILAISAAVVSLSRHPEAFGRTVGEALALGRPVAGYAHGGVGEQLAALFPDGRITPGDRAGMAQRLTDWSRQPPSLDATSPWTLHHMREATLHLYAELAGGRRQPPP
jgi:glycosyltransferase involved in cell wall biosynthesis